MEPGLHLNGVLAVWAFTGLFFLGGIVHTAVMKHEERNRRREGTVARDAER